MSNIAAGRLRHTIRFERQVTTKNASGETSIEWEAVGTYPCEIRPQTARELLVSQQINSESTTMLTMRYRSNIKASMRGVQVFNGVDGTIYNLTPPVRDSNSGMEWMQIRVTALLNAG